MLTLAHSAICHFSLPGYGPEWKSSTRVGGTKSPWSEVKARHCILGGTHATLTGYLCFNHTWTRSANIPTITLALKRCPREGQIRAVVFTQNTLGEKLSSSLNKPSAVKLFLDPIKSFSESKSCQISQDEVSHGGTFPIARLLFTERCGISGNYWSTTFPVVPSDVFGSRDALHMRTVPT